MRGTGYPNTDNASGDPGNPSRDAEEVAPAVKPLKIRIAQVQPMNSLQGVYVEYFKKLLEERSGGKIKVDHYPRWPALECRGRHLTTPPVGVNIFNASAIFNLPAHILFLWGMPFNLAEAAILFIVAYFPDVVLWLPRLGGLM